MQNFNSRTRRKELSVYLKYLFSFVLYLAVIFVFLLLGAFITGMLSDPLAIIKIAALSSLGISIIVSSALSTRIMGASVVCNLVCTAVIALILLFFSAVYKDGSPLLNSVILGLAIMILSAVTSFLSKKKPEKNKFRTMYKRHV